MAIFLYSFVYFAFRDKVNGIEVDCIFRELFKTKFVCVKISCSEQKLPWKIATETSHSLSSRLNMMRVGRVPELLQRIILFSPTCCELLEATPVCRPILAFFLCGTFCAYYKLVAFAWPNLLSSSKMKHKIFDTNNFFKTFQVKLTPDNYF